jgi:hypothetical protein
MWTSNRLSRGDSPVSVVLASMSERTRTPSESLLQSGCATWRFGRLVVLKSWPRNPLKSTGTQRAPREAADTACVPRRPWPVYARAGDDPTTRTLGATRPIRPTPVARIAVPPGAVAGQRRRTSALGESQGLSAVGVTAREAQRALVAERLPHLPATEAARRYANLANTVQRAARRSRIRTEPVLKADRPPAIDRNGLHRLNQVFESRTRALRVQSGRKLALSATTGARRPARCSCPNLIRIRNRAVAPQAQLAQPHLESPIPTQSTVQISRPVQDVRSSSRQRVLRIAEGARRWTPARSLKGNLRVLFPGSPIL